MGDRLTEIRNRLENGYYKGISTYVDGDIRWLLDYAEKLLDEAIGYRDAIIAVKTITDGCPEGTTAGGVKKCLTNSGRDSIVKP